MTERKQSESSEKRDYFSMCRPRVDNLHLEEMFSFARAAISVGARSDMGLALQILPPTDWEREGGVCV